MEEWCTTPPRKAKPRKMLEIAETIHGEDRISELPVHIIHHIVCNTSLNLDEAARTCVLSKRWYYYWISRPHLEFSQLPGNIHMTLEKFVTLVDESLQFYVEQKLHLEEFILTYHDPKLASPTDRWIELVVKHNVKMLGIHVSGSESPYYILPDVIYAAKELTKLGLSRCKFEFDISTTNIRFCCLKDLFLYNVHISDGQLQRVIDTCPFIRNLTILDCDGISKLHAFGLVHLEVLAVASCKLESVIVQAPNLRDYGYAGVHSIDDIFLPCKIAILDAYNTLQILTLTGASITDQQFDDVFSKFANISELSLIKCYMLKNIKIVSGKLKKLTLTQWRNLEKATIQAPNLLEFYFDGDKMPFSSMNPSSLERARLDFVLPDTVISNFGDVDRSWYTNLHRFVQKFNYSKGLIFAISCHKIKSILIYEDPREIVIPPSHDVKINIIPMLQIESLVYHLMFIRPKIMSILPCANSKVLQVLSSLKGCLLKENSGKKCAFNTELFNWYHELKEVINLTEAIEEEMGTIWYSWLKSTSLIDQVTNFMFKWEE